MKEYKTFWRAYFETPNFSFEAYGSTYNEALVTLFEGWKVHAKQTSAEIDYIEQYADDIDVYEVELMSCYRNRESDYPLIKHAIHGD